MINVKLTKVVSTYELPEVTVVNPRHERRKFIIQILLSPEGIYSPRVLRRDTYDVLPHYRDEDSDCTAMEDITVNETTCEWESFKCYSEEEAIQCVLDEFKRMGISFS